VQKRSGTIGDKKQVGLANNYLITLQRQNAIYKLCRIFFGSEGSYYVTSPYHRIKEAFLFKATVNYAKDNVWLPVSEMLDIAHLEDNAERLKLSHHPDGLLQFSGNGALSGVTPEGDIKGVGVISWPLDRPVKGPAFALVTFGVQQFDTQARLTAECCNFAEAELAEVPEPKMFILEGFYFPPFAKRFVRVNERNEPRLQMAHPSGAILNLKVLFPAAACQRQGFLGLDMYCSENDSGPETGFFLSGSTGNIRYNEQGEKLGDGIFCCYPKIFDEGRSLRWPPDQ
jgi:hypothetical protein